MDTSGQFPEKTVRFQRLKVLEELWQPKKPSLCCIWNLLLRCRKREISEEQLGKWVGPALGVLFTLLQTEPTVEWKGCLRWCK